MNERSYSPLRYPGGKSKLYKNLLQVVKTNKLKGATYVEPFAGGSAIALILLLSKKVNRIHINDYDRSIYAFWYSVMNHTEELIRLIMNTPITVDEWFIQKAIQSNKEEASLLELGFSTFFLNRTNRSGIILAGPIGGKDQSGDYKIDCRFNKLDLVQRIITIAKFKNHIKVTNLDAVELLQQLQASSERSFVYLDPPYYHKGDSLYMNFFNHDDHQILKDKLYSTKLKFVVSYDDCSEIRSIYKKEKFRTYDLIHNVYNKGKGKEIMYFSKNTRIPHNFFNKTE